MQKHSSRRLHAALPLAALAVSLSSVSHAQTAPTQSLGETVVTAARVPQDPSLLPQGVTVITAEQIQAAGMTTAHEAIRWLGGVVHRIDTSGGRNPALDLRGFGETASSNMVYLVDNVRQNEGDSSGVALSWIPIESIERIEIVRGSGSVLHGEGATAGVVNVITNKGLTEPGGSVGLSVGSNATTDARASVRTASGAWRFQLHANAFDTDNHRQNFRTQERNALARATWVDGASQLSIQLGGQSSSGGLPGGIKLTDFFTDPRKSYKLQDSGQLEKRNLQVSGETAVGDWRVALDLSRRMDEVDSKYVADGFKTYSSTQSSRVGARAWKSFTQGDVQQRLLLGFDSERWNQDRDHGDIAIEQMSDAFYARHEVELKSLGLKAYAGARRTLAKRDLTGSAVGSLASANTSWDLGLALKAGPSGEVFSRLGTSFRIANADEFACYPYFGACSPVNLLRPQTSRDAELGYRQSLSSSKWSVRYYRSDLTDEIGLDPALGNTNFDPTRRDGVELDGSALLAKAVEVGAQYAYRRAVFRSGSYQGSTVPMVPSQSLTARLTYRLSAVRQLSVTSQWVSSQRITEDFSNSCTDKIPGYGTVNLRYSEKVQDWTLSAMVNNLADKRYYNYRTRCSPTSPSIYPEPGRTLMVSAQRRF